MFILLMSVKYGSRGLFNQTTLLYVYVTLYLFSRIYSRHANATFIMPRINIQKFYITYTCIYAGT